MVKKKKNTTNINMVGKEGAKSSPLKKELCENISIFPGKWKACSVEELQSQHSLRRILPLAQQVKNLYTI